MRHGRRLSRVLFFAGVLAGAICNSLQANAQSCGLSGTLAGGQVTYTFNGTLEPGNNFGTLPAGAPFTGTLVYPYPQVTQSPVEPRGNYVSTSLTITFSGTGGGTVHDNGPGVINLYTSGGFAGAYPTDLLAMYNVTPVTGTLGGGISLATGAGLQIDLQYLPPPTGFPWSGATASSPSPIPNQTLTMADLSNGPSYSYPTFIQLDSNPGSNGNMTTARGFLNPCNTPPPPPVVFKICKVAGSGVAVNTPFTFTVGSTTVPPLPAGPSPGGYCEVVQNVPSGTVTVAETNFSPNVVSNISVAGAGTVVGTPNLAGGTVNISVGSGVTEVTYTDTATGYLEICKQMAPGLAANAGTSFTFNVNPASPGDPGPFSVPAGACTPPIQVPSGPVVITETPPAGYAMSSAGCTTIPAGDQGACTPPHSTVTVAPGGISNETIAYITNSRIGPNNGSQTGRVTIDVAPAIGGGKNGNTKNCDNPATCPK